MSKMLFLSSRGGTAERTRVATIHHKPEIVSEESRAHGIPVETLPKPDGRRKGRPVLFYNSVTGDLFYEYEEIPPPEEPPEEPEEEDVELEDPGDDAPPADEPLE